MATNDDSGRPAGGPTGARSGDAARRPEPSPGPRPAASAPVPAVHPGTTPMSVDEYDEPVEGRSSFVRPYVLTGGRTRSAQELSIEALVSAVPEPVQARLSGEQETVLGLCNEPRSVAELAATARMPLGVARVLVGDLAAAGAVVVHRTVGADGPDLALMQRVLSGLRRL